jgi:biopolymer transport protein ExbD
MRTHSRFARRIRRSSEDPRVELTPMIDVVFLLLTFFVFSIVLMIRADVLDVQLPNLTAGENAERVAPITIAIDDSGLLFVNTQPVSMSQIVERVSAIRTESPDSPLLLAVDVRSPSGVMIELADTLTAADLGAFSIVGRADLDEDPTETEPLTPELP